MTSIEDRAASFAEHVLALVEARREVELTEYLASLPVDDVRLSLIAVAAYLVDLEAQDRLDAQRNEHLRRRVSDMDRALVVATQERLRLTECVQGLREDRARQAALIGKLKNETKESRAA